MTKREMFSAVIAIVEASDVEAREELVSALNHEIELLDKKKASKKGLTKTQKENEPIMTSIVEALASCEEPVTVTDLIANFDDLNNFTNQKISALLRKLILDGKVVKNVEGKKAVFSLA